MKDWDNIAALGGAAIVALAVIIVQPDGPALAAAGTFIGGCLTYLQRRPVQ